MFYQLDCSVEAAAPLGKDLSLSTTNYHGPMTQNTVTIDLLKGRQL